jgi:RNA polymerase sigma-70 factor (ECF subfamily)
MRDAKQEKNSSAVWAARLVPGPFCASSSETCQDYTNSRHNAREKMPFDAQLMCRVRDGDAHCFGLLVEQYRLPVIHYLHRIVQNLAIAEELAQETFFRVYRARHTYEPYAKFSTWLFRIATHLAINALRDGRHERFRESIDSEALPGVVRQFRDHAPTIEETLLAGSRAQQIRTEINNLPNNQRAAVIMHKYEELGYAQIAQLLQTSEAAVKSLLFRAYERLRLRLAHFDSATVREKLTC